MARASDECGLTAGDRMSSEKTLAIVIRRVEFSESSYVATLFTEDFGKLTGMAKGARRLKSAFENALDLLSISRVVFIRKSSGAMDLLTEAKLERPFRAASRDLTRLYAGYYVAELLNEMTDERDPHPLLFRTAYETLLTLDADADVGIQVLKFELSMLKELGHLPSLANCVECGQRLQSEGQRLAFGQISGGVLCDRCKLSKRHVVSLSSNAVNALQRLSPGDEHHDTEGRELIEQGVRGELRGLMNSYVSHLLGRRPKMHGFLSGLR